MICATCKYFTPDPEGYGGIGQCALEVHRETEVMHWYATGNKDRHKGGGLYLELHRQTSLPYPGQAGCSMHEVVT